MLKKCLTKNFASVKAIKTYSLFVVLMIVSIGSVSAQERVDTVSMDTTYMRTKSVFYFKVNDTKIDPNYMDNQLAIDSLKKLIEIHKSNLHRDSLFLYVSTSPEGSNKTNINLVEKRLESASKYIQAEDISALRIFSEMTRYKWIDIVPFIEADRYFPYKSEVLAVIKNTKYTERQKENRLRTMRDGYVWKHMKETILKRFREMSFAIVSFDVTANLQVIEPEVVVPEYMWRWAIKTNLVHWAMRATPNIGFEYAINKTSTLDVNFAYNPWNRNGKPGDNQKAVHWLGQIELRNYFRESFDGHFFGVHAIGGEYNIGGIELNRLFGEGSKHYRHQGNVIGVGISYGYQWNLSDRLNLEASIGAGYAHLDYDRWEAPRCGNYVDHQTKDYFGPTKLSIALLYRFGQWRIDNK